MGMPPAKLGLIYSHTGLAKFIDVCGAGATPPSCSSWAATWMRERAREMGLVNAGRRPGARSTSAVLDMAAEIASNAPLSLAGNKRMIRELRSAAAARGARARAGGAARVVLRLGGLPRGRAGLHGEAQAGLARALGPDDPEAQAALARAGSERIHRHDAGAVAAGAERPAPEPAREARGLAARLLLRGEPADTPVARPLRPRRRRSNRDRDPRRLGQRVAEPRAALRLPPPGRGSRAERREDGVRDREPA